jgi:L-rhamnose mutarotase
MKRVGFILKVKADRLEEYKKHHQNVWPDMLDALRATGWRNYSLFMRDDGLLFGYFETPVDLKAAQDGMAQTEVNARWQAMMSPFFEIPPGAHPDQVLVELEEVFHTD